MIDYEGFGPILEEEDLVYRLRKRAEIRRQIPGRKSVQEGTPDRLADLLDEAAAEIDRLRTKRLNSFLVQYSTAFKSNSISEVWEHIHKSPWSRVAIPETIGDGEYLGVVRSGPGWKGFQGYIPKSLDIPGE